MKFSGNLRALLMIFLTLSSGASAQETSKREQFQTAVVAFQKNSTEDNARKLAELGKQLDPSPAVPEEARFHALKGAAFVKQAGDAAAFAKAAGEFQAAIALAPWVGEYHYNLAVCEKSAGQFPAALAALKFARAFARDDKERDDCLTLRADLEAAQELAATKQAEGEKAAAAVAKAKTEATIIVPGECIGRIRIGMPISEVEKVLGKPANVAKFNDGTICYYWTKTGTMSGPVYYTFIICVDSLVRVYSIDTWLPEYKTKAGVGVGSNISDLRREWGNPAKVTDDQYQPRRSYRFDSSDKYTWVNTDLTDRIIDIQVY